MAVLTPTPCSVPSSNTATHLIQIRSCLPHSASSEGSSRTSYLFCLAVINHTLLVVVVVVVGVTTLATREEALKNRHMKAAERWSEHTKRLPSLAVGNHVRIQNQTGLYPTKWDKTGVVIEVCQFDQYVVHIDGSGRMTTRNRKFLRKYLPVQTTPPGLTIDNDLRHLAMLAHRIKQSTSIPA